MRLAVALFLGLLPAFPLTTPAPPAIFNAPRDHAFHSPSAVVAADFNGDGASDVAFADWDRERVGVVMSGGQYQSYIVGPYPTAVLAADLTGDARPELVVTVLGTGQVSVLRNDGTGRFLAAQPSFAGIDPSFVVAADFNGDLDVDIAVANTRSGFQTIAVLLGNGDGTLEPRRVTQTEWFTLALATGDFDHDGRVDVAVGAEQAIHVLRGGGDGTFQPPISTPLVQTSFPSSLVAADFNADGHLDLAVTIAGQLFVRLFLGNGSLTFGTSWTSPQLGFRPMGSAAADFNEDSRVDLVVSGEGNETVTFLGEGNGGFRAGRRLATPHLSRSVAVGDFNGDHNADVVTAGVRAERTGGAIAIRYGKGNGSFLELPAPGTENVAMEEVTHGDFNGDAKVDLAIVLGGNWLLTAFGNDGGAFQAAAVTELPGFLDIVAAGDFDGDSQLDVVAAGTHLALFRGNGDGSFEPPSTIPIDGGVAALATADLDHDGVLDIVAKHYVGTSAYLGAGDGTFRAVVVVPGMSSGGIEGAGLAVGDFDRDGDLDVAASGSDDASTSIYLALGNGDGTFEQPIVISDDVIGDTDSLGEGDFNGDGIADLASRPRIRSGRPVRLLLGHGDGTFEPAVSYYAPFQVDEIHVADANGDGKADVMARTGTTLWVLAGTEDGTLSLQQTGFSTLTEARRFAMVDVNADGKPDAVVLGGEASDQRVFGAATILINVSL
jgi:hypothetical protein